MILEKQKSNGEELNRVRPAGGLGRALEDGKGEEWCIEGEGFACGWEGKEAERQQEMERR